MVETGGMASLVSLAGPAEGVIVDELAIVRIVGTNRRHAIAVSYSWLWYVASGLQLGARSDMSGLEDIPRPANELHVVHVTALRMP